MSRGENKENTRSRKDHFKTPIRVCGFFHCWKPPSLGLAFKTEILFFFFLVYVLPKQAQDWNHEAWPGWLHPHFLSTATSQTYSLPQMLVAQSCPTLRNHMVARLLWPQNSPGKNTEVGCHFLLQGIFPTQESNLGLPHCGQILHHLSQKESPISLPRPFFNYQPYQPFSMPRNRSSHVLLMPGWVMVPRAEDNVVSNTFQCLSAPHPGPRPKRLLSQRGGSALALHPALSLFITKTVLAVHLSV